MSYSEDHPYSLVITLSVVIASTLLLAGEITSWLKLPEITLYFMSNGILAVLAIILLTRMGWWKAVGFRALQRNRDLWLFAVPAAPIVLNLAGGINSTAADTAILFALAALVGFVEESFFRGLMLRPLALLGRWSAVIVTAIIFGLMHSQHILRGTDPSSVLMQMTFATAIGFTYAALVLRTAVIWPLMVVHCLTDFTGFAAAGGLTITGNISQQFMTVIVYLAVFIGYGIWLAWDRSKLRYYSVDLDTLLFANSGRLSIPV